MNKEIQQLVDFSKMNGTFSKSEFVRAFKAVIRTGNDEEVRKAYEIINTMASTPDLENFCQGGMEVYKTILKSKLYYYQLTEVMKNFKNSQSELAMVDLHYSRIKDEYFLQKANSLIKNNQMISGKIEIRKTKKEVEEEKENMRDKLNTFQHKYFFVFEKLNEYLGSQLYTIEKTKAFFDELDVLRFNANQYRDVLGNERYQQIIEEIGAAKRNLNSIVSGFEEEQRMWKM